jgi:hypothetical protein
VADVPSGLSLTPPRETKKEKKKNVDGVLRILSGQKRGDIIGR